VNAVLLPGVVGTVRPRGIFDVKIAGNLLYIEPGTGEAVPAAQASGPFSFCLSRKEIAASGLVKGASRAGKVEEK
jgi:hypothetical protein